MKYFSACSRWRALDDGAPHVEHQLLVRRQLRSLLFGRAIWSGAIWAGPAQSPRKCRPARCQDRRASVQAHSILPTVSLVAGRFGLADHPCPTPGGVVKRLRCSPLLSLRWVSHRARPRIPRSRATPGRAADADLPRLRMADHRGRQSQRQRDDRIPPPGRNRLATRPGPAATAARRDLPARGTGLHGAEHVRRQHLRPAGGHRLRGEALAAGSGRAGAAARRGENAGRANPRGAEAGRRRPRVPCVPAGLHGPEAAAGIRRPARGVLHGLAGRRLEPRLAAARASRATPSRCTRALSSKRDHYSHEINSRFTTCCGTPWDGTYYLTQDGTPDKPIAIVGAAMAK